MESHFLIVLSVGISLAVVIDATFNKIPNWLTGGMIIGALVLHIWFEQWGGVWVALTGLIIGLLLFLPFNIFGAMGAGDVKLMAAVGSLVGPSNVFWAALFTVAAGGVIALGYVAARGGLFPLVRRYISMITLLVAQQPQYIPPAQGEVAGKRFPYAFAIACGTAIAVAGF